MLLLFQNGQGGPKCGNYGRTPPPTKREGRYSLSSPFASPPFPEAAIWKEEGGGVYLGRKGGRNRALLRRNLSAGETHQSFFF